jgi:hypothetical protein
MKKLTINHKAAKFVTLIFIFALHLTGFAQEKKSMNIALQYVKVMQENSLLKVSVQYKGKNGFEPCKYLHFSVFKKDTINDANSVKIGTFLTNSVGKSNFVIPAQYVAESGVFSVKIENNSFFEDQEEQVIIKAASITASIDKDGDQYTINAILTDGKGQPIAGEALQVGLKRLFGNLPIGEEESYETDSIGAVAVPIDAGLTGVDGKLNFQVVLSESDVYGTIINNQMTNNGIPIKDRSSFNKRTMWSPPTKTPLFLWIVPNTLLISIWSILTYLLFNLIKIYKSKN